MHQLRTTLSRALRQRLRGHDVPLIAAGLTFYGLIGGPPLMLLSTASPPPPAMPHGPAPDSSRPPPCSPIEAELRCSSWLRTGRPLDLAIGLDGTSGDA